MAFEVETGSSSATATSYVTVAEADAYHADHGAPTAWSGAVEGDKQAALIDATRYLDAMYNALWVGDRKTRTQALDWPRLGAFDESGFSIGTTEIPREVKEACYILALKSISGTTLMPDDSPSGTIKREKIQVGPITEDIEYAGSKGGAAIEFNLVESTLTPVLEGGGIGLTMERS